MTKKTIMVLAAYLAWAAVLAVCAPGDWAIAAYALSIVWVALKVVRRRNWVDKQVSDQLYYSLAVLAVALVYIYETPGRERLDLHMRHFEARQMGQNAESQAQALASHIAHLGTLVQRLKDAPEDLPAAVRTAALQSQQAAQVAASQFCKEIEQAMAQERLKARLDTSTSAQPSQMQSYWSAKTQHDQCEKEERKAKHPLYAQLKMLRSLDEFKPLGALLERERYLNGAIILDNQRYTFSDLVEASNQPQSIRQLDVERDAALAQVRQAQATLKTLGAQLDQVDDPAHFTYELGLAGQVIKFGWPFLLIALLGLKLSVHQAPRSASREAP